MPLPPEFNSPACMLARLGYVLHLGGILGGLGGIIGSAQRGDASLLGFAGLALLLAFILRRILVRSGWYSRCRDSFASLGQDDVDPRLGRLIEQRSELERLRGTPAFDPWALLAVQHEIDAHVRAHPTSAEPRPRTHGGSAPRR